MQRTLAGPVLRFNVCSFTDQKFCQICITLHSGNMQSGLVIFTRGIDIGTFSDESLSYFPVSTGQGGIAGRSFRIYVSTF